HPPICFLYRAPPTPHLHSFPTRRSSDLKTITYRGKEYAGSPLTAFLQKHINSTEGNTSWFADWARQLEKTCKVPYDEVKGSGIRSEEHTSELQSRENIVCRLLLEKKKQD